MTELAVEQTTPDAGPASAPETTPDPLDADLKTIAEVGDNDDYRREREDQEAYKQGDPALYDERRKQEYDERWRRVYDKMQKDTANALKHESSGFEDRIRSERILAQAELRCELYERENPGFRENVRATLAAYGDVKNEAGQVILESPRAPEILDRICGNPEAIAALNQFTPRDLDRFVARMEGLIDGMGHAAPNHAPQPPKPKTFSSAPPPVKTVSGNSHQASKKPDEMNYDEYKAWRNRGAG